MKQVSRNTEQKPNVVKNYRPLTKGGVVPLLATVPRDAYSKTNIII